MYILVNDVISLRNILNNAVLRGLDIEGKVLTDVMSCKEQMKHSFR